MSTGETSRAAERRPSAPSEWVLRFAPLIPAGGEVLDVACGAGRHTRLLLERGLRVVCVDRDTSGIADLVGRDGLRIVCADLEAASLPPVLHARYAAVVVTNYLHRPLLPRLLSAVADGGLLVYETFAAGNATADRGRRRTYWSGESSWIRCAENSGSSPTRT